MTSYGIVGTGHRLPDRVIDNATVAAPLGIDPRWITASTGILTRRAADPSEAASDLAADAVRRALENAGREPSDVGVLVIATSTPDDLGPSTACRVAARLGVRSAAVDVVAACAGYLYGLQLARGWLRENPGRGCAVVAGVEVYSRFIDPTDRSTAVIFGDGAGASVIDRVPAGTGLGAIRLGSDGTGADHVRIPAGGSRAPATLTTVETRAHTIRMDAAAVRADITTVFPQLVRDAVADEPRGLDAIDHLIPHQPNPRTLRMFADAIDFPLDRIAIVGEHIGNIGAASLPTALDLVAPGLAEGDRVLLIGIGAGMTWGSAWMTWHRPTKETP